MRQRKIHDVESKIARYEYVLVRDPDTLAGRWRECLSSDNLDSVTGGAAGGRRDPDAQAGRQRECLSSGNLDSVTSGTTGGRRDPDTLAGQWRECLSSDNLDSAIGGNAGDRAAVNSRKLFVEIGSGKGRFLIDKAASDPDNFYVGFEGQLSVLYRAVSKVPANAAANFKFCPEYIYDIREFFAEGEISGIFLNFSDPWPKARQEKRRLTSPVYLTGYRHVLAPGGTLEFKTDNGALFEYSARQIDACQGFELTAVTDDLHRSEFAEANIETEYEHKFRNLNRKIKFLRAVKTFSHEEA
ncbi:MAG: tRNA (guanosine(46)-N7)-methyltransferase TrmB [Clostridiales Family XIII bacterium]|jgi:tRNA (guanine-N7-)-methyltransferase|nr:tRNA (guanosine(46)-N7)-methyltransferase TrmB [Clostridiales Family XIII bacterium]